MTEIENHRHELVFEDDVEQDEEEDNEVEELTLYRPRHVEKDPSVIRRQVLGRYVCLSTLAVVVTVTCPQTFLWTDDGSLHRPWFVVRLLIVYATTLTFLTFGLQGSDPGYLTVSVMQRLDDYERRQEGHSDELTESETEDSGKGRSSAPTISDGTKHIPPRETPELAPFPAESTTTSHDRLALLEDGDGDGYRTHACRSTRRPPCRHCPSSSSPPPLRSFHCHKCQRHVPTFDHHCDFIGTCIGEANHARFWLFLTLQGYGFAMCFETIDSSPLGILSRLWTLAKDSSHATASSSSSSSWAAVLYVLACRIYLYPLAAAAVLLWMLHTFLACTNSTTLEFVKGPRHLEYLHPQTRLCDLPFSRPYMHSNLVQWIRRDASWLWLRRKMIRQRTPQDVEEDDYEWTPTLWQRPGPVIHDSEKWWKHPWQNKYWSCC